MTYFITTFTLYQRIHQVCHGKLSMMFEFNPVKHRTVLYVLEYVFGGFLISHGGTPQNQWFINVYWHLQCQSGSWQSPCSAPVFLIRAFADVSMVMAKFGTSTHSCRHSSRLGWSIINLVTTVNFAVLKAFLPLFDMTGH